MIKYITSPNNIVIAELTNNNFIISEVQDALDLISGLGTYNCNRIIIRESNLIKDFFSLKTRMAGDILQKFSTYGVKLAIVGDFSKFRSTALKDFIRESNRGNQVFFVDDIKTAMARLSK